jgi:hypothetical protein
MKKSYRKMSAEEFENYRPHSEEEWDNYTKEKEFREWCKEDDQDPADSDVRELYNDIERECGRSGLDDSEEND